MDTTAALGISLGTRTVGLAVIANRRIRDRRIKNFKGALCEDKLLDILQEVESWVLKYRVSAIALKAQHPARTSAALSALAGGIEDLAQKHCVPAFHYPIEEIERFFSRRKQVNKAVLMDCITGEYPELSGIFMRAQEGGTYYVKLFEAIGAAALCAHELS